jgi:hypothetical protein
MQGKGRTNEENKQLQNKKEREIMEREKVKQRKERRQKRRQKDGPLESGSGHYTEPDESTLHLHT